MNESEFTKIIAHCINDEQLRYRLLALPLKLIASKEIVVEVVDTNEEYVGFYESNLQN